VLKDALSLVDPLPELHETLEIIAAWSAHEARELVQLKI
jgi:hypothetical protein